MITNVLVPLDLTRQADRALSVGAALAERAGADLRAVVITSPGLPPSVDEAEVKLHAAAAGVTIDEVYTWASQDAAVELLSATDEAETLLCMATHGRGALAELVLSSVSESVVRHAKRPVVLVGPHATRTTFRELVVCVEGPGNAERDERLVDAAGEWASVLGLRPVVFQAQLASGGGEAGTAYFDQMAAGSAYVEKMAARLADRRPDVTTETARGGAVEAISDLAAARPGALLMLGTHAPSRWARFIHHSVALDVAHDAEAPVLVLPLPDVTASQPDEEERHARQGR